MKSATLLLAAALVLVVLTIFWLRPPPSSEPFLGTFQYAPQCGADWGGWRRPECRGITTGVMPSIETDSVEGCGLGCGRLGGISP